MGGDGYFVYGASKGAVNAFSHGTPVELAPAVRVNAVLPGIIGTEMNTEHFADAGFVEWVRATHPLGLGRPEDVADAVEDCHPTGRAGLRGRKLLWMAAGPFFANSCSQPSSAELVIRNFRPAPGA